MTIDEAILFRILVSVFGKDRVIPGMSLKALVGVEYNFSCLFTVVNDNDLPRMVVEFYFSDSDTIDLKEMERKKIVEKILIEHDIRYITISEADFLDIRGADSKTLINFFQDKCIE